MYKLVGMVFKALVAIIFALARATEDAFAISPAVLNFFETHIAFGVCEACNAVFAVGVLATIHTAARQKTCHFGNGNPK